MLAQAPGASPAEDPELVAIDRRIAELLATRPTDGRVEAGALMTVFGGLAFIGGGAAFAALVSNGTINAVFLALVIGVPVMVVGLGLLIPGVLLWVTGRTGQRRADEELAALRAQRAQLLGDSPRPGPNVPSAPVPETWREAPRPAFTLARF